VSRKLVLALALLGTALAAPGCAPKPPAKSPPAAGTSPAAARSASPGSAPGAPATRATATQAQPIKAISRGTRSEPARYVARNAAGQIVYDVRSQTVVYDRAPDGSGVATFTLPHIIFRDRSGRTVVADAPKAVAHDRDKSVVMTGGVRAETDDGKVLTCATLSYDEQRAQIQCEGDVVLTNTKTNQTASGQSLVTDPGFEHVTLSGSR
jgi:LPS export ABC transporter protein LptC